VDGLKVLPIDELRLTIKKTFCRADQLPECAHAARRGCATGRRRTLLVGIQPALLLALHLFSTLCHAAGQTGVKVASFSLKDPYGKVHSLSDYAGKVVVLSFWSFKCPVSLANDEHLKALQTEFEGKGVVVLAVSSNANESAEEVRRNAANLKLPYPVLLDEEGTLSERLSATHAPSIFIIDGASNLRYQGSFVGDKKGVETRSGSAARDAIDDILAGRPVRTPETRFSGCLIRRKTI
jgi:peroxiredoxin